MFASFHLDKNRLPCHNRFLKRENGMTAQAKIRIGTRGSELALWQARHVAGLLGAENTEIVIIKTKGDRIQNVSFDKMEGKGFFTKEIEDALLAGTVDLAVHSFKDLPTEPAPGLEVAAITRRENPSDILLIAEAAYQGSRYLPLADGAAVGTSSLRRAAQLLHENPSLRVEALRGNVTTRVRKLREGAFDAIVIAFAGLSRLGLDLSGLVARALPYSFFLPAPAQGALALQIRADDTELKRRIGPLNHHETEIAVCAERAFLRHFGGGCHIPLGAFAYLGDDGICLSGMIASTDGAKLLRETITGADPDAIGESLARTLKDRGADALL
jgi:hydroxymethylbilane synthase